MNSPRPVTCAEILKGGNVINWNNINVLYFKFNYNNKKNYQQTRGPRIGSYPPSSPLRTPLAKIKTKQISKKKKTLYFQTWLLTFASEKLMMRLRTMAFTNILKQAVGWFDNNDSSPGHLTTKLARDAPVVKAVSVTYTIYFLRFPPTRTSYFQFSSAF